jgi:hypothetical protein
MDDGKGGKVARRDAAAGLPVCHFNGSSLTMLDRF